MSDKIYEDNSNSEQIISDFKNILSRRNPLEVQVFLENNYPGWLVGVCDGYSTDYKFLENNWKIVCDKIGVNPQRIITVQKVFFDKKEDVRHHTIMTICEELTRCGYVIRRADEFINCDTCFSAMPSYEVWDHMRSKELPVPEKWDTRCSGCK
jgi:hypothetical protein